MRILHAIHDFLPRRRAGSEIYAFHLCRELSRRHDVTVLCADYDPAREHGSVTWRTYEGLPVAELVNNWAFARFEDTYRPPAFREPLREVLMKVRPDVLHIHNLVNLSVDLPALACARGIPSVATLHDYTLLCPSGGQRVHIAEEHVCHVIDPDRCRRCFPQSRFAALMRSSRAAAAAGTVPGVLALAGFVRRRFPRAFGLVEGRLGTPPAVTVADITRRLEAAREVFASVDLFVAPSQALADEFRAAGLPAEKLRVSEYGFVRLPRVPRAPASRLRLGFVGTLAWPKGVHVLIEAVRDLPAGRVEVEIFGDLHVFPDHVRALRACARGLPVRFRGAFDESRTGEVYGGIDVLVVPSLWPENSPLVIHEAFMAGVPVVGARLGGIPELVTHEVNGLVYDANSPGALAAVLRRLVDDPDLVARFARELPAVKSIEQDAVDWEAHYARVARGAQGPPASNAADPPDRIAVPSRVRS